MITQDDFLNLLSRVTTAKPLDIDSVLYEPAPEVDQSFDLTKTSVPTCDKLWNRDESGVSYIGIRVNGPIADIGTVATRLAAAALERGVVPIILSATDNCELRRFGFRVETISAGSPEELQLYEQQLQAMWSLAIIIDAEDVARLA